MPRPECESRLLSLFLIVAEALELFNILSIYYRYRDDVILLDLFAGEALLHNVDCFLDHGRIIGDREEVKIGRPCDGLMLILQDRISFSQT